MNHRKVSVLAAALALLSGCGDSGNRRAPLDSILESVAVSRKVDKIDADGDSSPNKSITYTYNAQGDPLTLSYDINADGTADRICTSAYDVRGRLLSGIRDSDGDGIPNEMSQYHRDINGGFLSQGSDDDADEKTDRIADLGHCGYL